MAWLGVSNRSISNPFTPPVRALNWAPGVHWQVGNSAHSNGVSDNTTHADVVRALNPSMKGIECCYTWAQLENPNQQGDYSGNWDATGNSGFIAIQSLLNYCNAHNLKLSLSINTSGNAETNGSNSWPSGYAPLYLNSTTYGPVSGNNHGGLYYTSTTAANTTGPVVRLWNANVWTPFAAMWAAYERQFPGLILRLDPCMELSLGNLGPSGTFPDAGYSDAALIAALAIGIPALRMALPKALICLRPTFMGMSSYPSLFAAIMPSAVSISPYDGANEIGSFNRVVWGMAAYAGTFPNPSPNGPTQSQPGWINYQSLGYDAHWHLTSDVLGQDPNFNQPIPPARVGSGLLALTSASSIMATLVKYACSHLFVTANGFGGPNCNRVSFSSTAPANPNPPDGPGGGVAAHPLLPELMEAAFGLIGNYGALVRASYPTAAAFN